VTHDQVEAMTMSDRVAMMDNGTILQLGRPGELYARPANVKVAQFIGTPAINLLPARVSADASVELFGSELPIHVARPPSAGLTLGIRPEAISPAPFGTTRPGLHAMPGRLRRSENLGAEYILHVDLLPPATGSIICSLGADPETLIDGARNLMLLFAPAACHVFDADGIRIADIDTSRAGTGVAPLARAV